MNILAIGAHFDDLELGCGGMPAMPLVEDRCSRRRAASTKAIVWTGETPSRTEED
jgi:hypothetical protein